MAATTDVLTIEVAKAALGSSEAVVDKDALIASYVTAVSQTLDQMCGPIVQRTVAERLDGGRRAVWLRAGPVASFTTVTEYSGGTGVVLAAETAVAAGGYLAEPDSTVDPAGLYSGKLWRRSGWSDRDWVAGRGNVVVVAQAGRYASTAAVAGSRFERAAVIALKHLYAAERNNVAPVGGFDTPNPTFPTTLPRVIRELLFEDLRDSGGVTVG